MSKSTETTNDRVPRVLVRFGKHPSSVGNTHRVYGNTIECMETPSSVWKHPSSVWKHPSSVWKHHRAWGNTRESWGNVGKRGETWGVPGRCRRGAEALPKGGRGLNEIYLLNNKIHKNKYESIIGKCR